MKAFLKYILYQLHLAGWLDRGLFRFQQLNNKKINQQYLAQHPGIILPADYDLYETYQLNYRKFIEDGKLAASEIIEWTKPYIGSQHPDILDWGCGVGRIIRHLKEQQPAATLYACDSNLKKIAWNKAHYSNIYFELCSNSPSTDYPSYFFDMVYGISVITHIEDGLQLPWLLELHRILKPNGILLLTTQGKNYFHKLLPGEKKILDENGMYTRYYPEKGHRMMSTYHQADYFGEFVTPYFFVLEYYDGEANPEKAGGQDVWILRKE